MQKLKMTIINTIQYYYYHEKNLVVHLLSHNQTSVSKANSGFAEDTDGTRQNMEDPRKIKENHKISHGVFPTSIRYN
jgi:hypothetical protein